MSLRRHHVEPETHPERLAPPIERETRLLGGIKMTFDEPSIAIQVNVLTCLHGVNYYSPSEYSVVHKFQLIIYICDELHMCICSLGR